MTLTELRDIAAVARERHFGRAADACFVNQPALSVAIEKLEEELGVALFERRANDVAVTALGKRVVEQAQRVPEEAEALKQIAVEGQNRSTVRCGSGQSVRSGRICCPT
jgi:LysR family hydrogen peroxide-inducible transcriptional activator